MKQRDNFRFVETRQTRGVVQEIQKEADKQGRSLNNYIGQILKRWLYNKTKRNLEQTRDHIDTGE
jgi:hypothetical protein